LIWLGLMHKLFKRFNFSRRSKEQRVVVIHNHLFKNAGSSIDWALKKNFSSSFVDHRQDDLMRQGASYLGPYLEGKVKVRALSTHHLVLPLPELKKVHLLVMTMFRHPIERVTSVYNFERKQKCNSTPGVIHARKLPIADYIRWRLRPEVGGTIRNFHARRMLPFKKSCREDFCFSDIELIEASVKNMDMLGIVDKFDESMVLFEETLRKYFSDIDLSYVPQNIGQKVGESKEARLAWLEAEIGRETYELLVQRNKHDIGLYDYIQEEFQRRVDGVENFSEKLESFKKRCLKHG